jgi:hypothetical protein
MLHCRGRLFHTSTFCRVHASERVSGSGVEPGGGGGSGGGGVTDGEDKPFVGCMRASG